MIDRMARRRRRRSERVKERACESLEHPSAWALERETTRLRQRVEHEEMRMRCIIPLDR